MKPRRMLSTVAMIIAVVILSAGCAAKTGGRPSMMDCVLASAHTGMIVGAGLGAAGGAVAGAISGNGAGVGAAAGAGGGAAVGLLAGTAKGLSDCSRAETQNGNPRASTPVAVPKDPNRYCEEKYSRADDQAVCKEAVRRGYPGGRSEREADIARDGEAAGRNAGKTGW